MLTHSTQAYYQPPFYSVRHTFSSKERDTETGLSYFGARYYNSDLSIWLSVDPMSGKYPHQSNYVYCSNNPLKVIDPNGEDEWELARDGTLEFAAENTDVEWAISSSDCESRVGTAKSNNVSMPSVKNEKEFYHSHDVSHSGKDYMGYDDYAAAQISHSKNVKTGIYMAGEKRYYMYEEITFPNGTFFNYFGTKEHERKQNKQNSCN